jgi:hypothetical protein
MYGLLAHAPMLAFAAVSQYDHSPLLRDFVVLPVDLPMVTASIGAITLKGRLASPLNAKLVSIIHDMARGFELPL